MSEYTNQINFDTHEHHLPNQSFGSWLKSQTALLITQLIGLASVGYVITALLYHLKVTAVPGIFDPGNIQSFIMYAHIPFLLLFIASLLSILDRNLQGSYRSQKVYETVFQEKLSGARLRKGRVQLRKFKLYFIGFWIFMLVLYFSLILQKSAELPHLATALSQAINSTEGVSLQSNLSSSVSSDKGADSSDGGPKALGTWVEALDHLKFQLFVFSANNLSVMWIFMCFSVLVFPWHRKKSYKSEKRFRRIGIFLILFITACYPLFLSFASNKENLYTLARLQTYTTLADSLSGVLNAIIFALLIARLDDKLIGLPSYLIGILYGYAAVQPLFALFGQPGPDSQLIKAIVLIAVFIFKIHFFLIITYTLQTGRMLDYLICFPELAQRVDSIFSNQFQIELCEEYGKLYFSIADRDEKIYSGKKRFATQEAYTKEIDLLKKVSQLTDSYVIEGSFGTYWVEIFAGRRKLCRSEDLKSREEAKELIAKSIQKISACKVTFSKK